VGGFAELDDDQAGDKQGVGNGDEEMVCERALSLLLRGMCGLKDEDCLRVEQDSE
jgi:hypothetical protein